RAQARHQGERRRAPRVVQTEPRELQMPAPRGVRRDPENLDRKDPEIQAARDGEDGVIPIRWSRHLLHLSPHAGRGRFASGAPAQQSKWGGGACPQAQTRGYAPSPGFLRCARNPTSPRTRGEVEQAALPRTSRYQLECDSPAACGEEWSKR